MTTAIPDESIRAGIKRLFKTCEEKNQTKTDMPYAEAARGFPGPPHSGYPGPMIDWDTFDPWVKTLGWKAYADTAHSDKTKLPQIIFERLS